MYLKGQLQIHKQNRIIRYIPSMFRLEKGVNNYLHESISEFHYTAPSIYDRKIRAVSSTFPSNRGQIFDIFDYMKFNLYAPSVMENKILSPLNRSAKVHYYYLLDSISPQLGSNLYKIRFIPRYHSTQLLEGFIWISSEDWAIRYVNVSGKYDLIHFHLSMKMGDTEESKYLPILLNLTLNFKFLRNHLTMKYTGWMKYNEIVLRKPGEDLAVFRKQKKEHYNLSQSYTLTCDTSSLISDRDSFNRIRPIPLSASEDSLYWMADERQRQKAADTLDTKPSKRKKNLVYLGQLGDALISSYDIDISKFGTVNCSPLINPLLVSYSHRNGISYRQVFKYNKLFHDGRLLRIAPQIGYNFTKKSFMQKQT